MVSSLKKYLTSLAKSHVINLLYLTEIDGGYSEWSSWSQCSTTCGDGHRSRGRSCTNPPPSGGGKDCAGLGPGTETRDCSNGDCPVPSGE